MTPRAIVERYVELLNARRFDEVGDLWAEDGAVFNGFGQVLEGKAAVSAFYSAFKDASFPKVRSTSFMVDEAARVCAVEIEIQMTHNEDGTRISDPEPFTRASLDLFAINADGKVQKMIAYIAPPNKWLPT